MKPTIKSLQAKIEELEAQLRSQCAQIESFDGERRNLRSDHMNFLQTLSKILKNTNSVLTHVYDPYNREPELSDLLIIQKLVSLRSFVSRFEGTESDVRRENDHLWQMMRIALKDPTLTQPEEGRNRLVDDRALSAKCC